MPKGDHTRSENRQDEQMKQSQGYLTGLQSQLAGQYGGLSGNYFGATPSPTNSTFGYGSTVPHFSWTGQPYYSGNGTDTPTTSVGSSRTPSAQANYEQQFRQLFPGSSLSPEQLAGSEQQLQQMGIRLLGPNAAGQRTKIELPDGRIIDVIGGAGAGKNRLQWMDDSGGNSIGFNGGNALSSGGVVGRNLNDYSGIMSRFQNFADTGGFSEGDKANIRSRAVSPIRSIYSSARQGLDRQRALQGGYAPGQATALSRFSREQGQLTSDAATNAEAAIAEMTQRGKLAGMGGMASIYGATPGLSSMFGNQMLQGMGQQLQASGLQNQLSLGSMSNQNQMAQIPGNYQQALGNISGTIGLGGQIGGMIYPWLGGGGGSAGAATGQYGAVNNYGSYL